MSRSKKSVICKNKHKKILSQAKGYYGARSRTFKVAKQAVIKAAQYAYRDRKNRKRTMRSLWIQRINAAVRGYGLNYSSFMHLLSKNSINIDRKMLAELCVCEKDSFAQLVKQVSLD